MKKLTIFLFATLVGICIFASCGSDDDGPNYETEILGSWNGAYNSLHTLIQADTANIDIEFFKKQLGMLSPVITNVKFSINKTGSYVCKGVETQFTYSIDGTRLLLFVEGKQQEYQVALKDGFFYVLVDYTKEMASMPPSSGLPTEGIVQLIISCKMKRANV